MKRGGLPGLFEFLEEADLPQYYHSLRNVLRVYQVQQLKYVRDEELTSIGMSKTEARRLKVSFQRHNPQTYTTKLKKFLLPHKSKDEFLLDESSEPDPLPSPNHVQHNSGIKVPRQHIISPDAIKICKELGSGEFGVVEQGVLSDGNRTHQVAIKSLCKDRLHNSMFEFMKEYEIMQSIDHPNIVKLFGVVLETSRIMLITELAPLRSLLECLKEPGLRPTLNVVCLANFAQQICEGMKYLESMRLIHRDLAARNILVFSKNLVKVSDFGLSRALGVGKDYYQTNFNANLKLPIAWCAPECITFLKFTSASDVWAFGVTLWEMFSYGFQPWAAQTGQQILEAIDEPNCQRLEQPLHCPADYYLIMHQCWRHDPNARPTFDQLVSILEDAKPEQVQAIQASNPSKAGLDRNLLEFEVGTIITVLDKPVSTPTQGSVLLWTGVRDDTSAVGLFSPSQTVAYLDSLPTSQSRMWSQPGSPTRNENHETTSVFQRGTYRSLSRSGRKKLSRDMISRPQGEVQHCAHIGIDGMHFGNVAGFFDFKSPSYASMPCLSGSGASFSLGQIGDSSSELAPLINSTKGSSNAATKKSSTFDGHQTRNPRLGYTIGYLRHKGGGSTTGTIGSIKDWQEKHEYQSISDDGDKSKDDDDDLFLAPPDLGPSLMDEVLSELSGGGDDDKTDSRNEPKKSSDLKDLKDLMSSLTISRRQKKKLAAVKPIKASDERTLENAIAMANVLASKSMHELDKRTTDHFYDSSPGPSPITPNSPAKRFSFWFPTSGSHHHGSHHRSSSPKSERKPFSEVINSNTDLETTLSTGEKNAYKALIEGCSAKASDSEDEANTENDFGACGSMTENDNAAFCETPTNNNVDTALTPTVNNNPLPLPPKSASLYQTSAKRHVRKNPLILPSSRVTNLINRSESLSDTSPVFTLQAPPLNRADIAALRRKTSHDTSSKFGHCPYSMTNHDSSIYDVSKKDVSTCVVAPLSRNSVDAQTYSNDDAFESAIESQIDALDDIVDSSSIDHDQTTPKIEPRFPKSSMANSLPAIPKGNAKDIDEVRIIQKVVGRPVDRSVCLSALTLARWDIHLAIKIIRLANLVYDEQGVRLEVSQKSTLDILKENQWDVDKAAYAILNRHQQYF